MYICNDPSLKIKMAPDIQNGRHNVCLTFAKHIISLYKIEYVASSKTMV